MVTEPFSDHLLGFIESVCLQSDVNVALFSKRWASEIKNFEEKNKDQCRDDFQRTIKKLFSKCLEKVTRSHNNIDRDD